MKKLVLIFITIIFISNTKAQNASWSANIAPLIYGKCATCHHTGGIAPFPLMSYSDAAYHAADISNDVTIHKMPPWPPDPSYRHLAHERVLSQAEINAINDWVNNGTPPGDTTLAPAPPAFSNAAILPGVPDLIVTIPTYTVDTTYDIYRCFVIPSGLITQKHISGFEVIPVECMGKAIYRPGHCKDYKYPNNPGVQRIDPPLHD